MTLDETTGTFAAPVADDARPGFSALLREPNMRRLWGAQAFSSAGEALATIAMPLLVYELTDSARIVGLIALILILPRVLLAPVTGLLADRMNRRRLMMFSDAWRLVLVVMVPFTTEIWQLALLALGIAIGTRWPARPNWPLSLLLPDHAVWWRRCPLFR